MDPPGSSVHEILQARILEWVAISFSKGFLIKFGAKIDLVLILLAAATAKSLQSCPTLYDPIPGILQARTLEWVAISFSNA